MSQEHYVVPGVFKHHKDGRYTVLGVSECSTNGREGEWVVWYVSLTTGKMKHREIGEFFELVSWPDGELRPRFVRE